MPASHILCSGILPEFRVQIIDLPPDRPDLIKQVATMLVEVFKEPTPAWPDMESALKEVAESFEPERLSRVAVSEKGEVFGWIGGISQYDGNVWELHPLVVRPDK